MEIYQQLAVAALVIIGLAATLHLLKRRGLVRVSSAAVFGNSKKRLSVEERVFLTPQVGLCLVRRERRTLLVAFSPNGCQVLEEGRRAEENE